ncbi:MAG: NAD(P)/FAD-dependent oxidoreductase [Lachnospiraceae bacterium]|nr:NAD(P)/FAD-dependent oxidoreductase [Lachnospiraceae bacterium]
MREKEILILGGGVAGLSAGIFALKKGYRVTIAEQHNIAGGNLTGWNRNGFHIDNCIHWLTGTNKNSGLYKMWEELGALGDGIKVVKNEALYCYEKDGQSLSLWRSIDKTAKEMLELSPKDARRIRKFRRSVKNIMFINGIGGKKHNESGNIFNKMASLASILYFNRMSVVEYGEKFHHPLLKEFFSSLMGPDFSMAAFAFVAATYCGNNGDLPEGGSFAMAEHMIERFKSLGGRLLTRKKASKINVEDNLATSVTFEDGDTIKADKIIVTFDPKMLFGKLLDIKLPRPFKKIYESKAFKRFSSIHAAFAVDAADVPFKGTLVVDIPEDLQPVLKAKSCIVREFSHEKKYSPEGRNIIQTMIYMDEDNSKGLVALAKNRAAYRAKKDQLKAAQLELVERQVPALKGKLTELDAWTPASYARYVGSEIGSFMSFVMPAGKAPVSIGSRVKKVKNLFLATQWQTSPGGLPMAASAGKKAVETIEKTDKKRRNA